MDAISTDSTMPFRLAQVYGTARQRAGARIEPGAANSAPVRAARAKLVAGIVPGAVDFTVGDRAAGSDVIPMHASPAERNAAATGVELGRRIDVHA